MDYTVEFTNNTNVGKDNILVKGICHFSGELNSTFNINPAENKITNFIINKDGQMSIESTFGSNTPTFTFYKDLECTHF